MRPFQRVPISVLLGGSVGALLAISIAIVIAYMSAQARNLIEVQLLEAAKLRTDQLLDAVDDRLNEIERLALAISKGMIGNLSPVERDAGVRALLLARPSATVLQLGDSVYFRDPAGDIRQVTANSAVSGLPSGGWSADEADGSLTFSIGSGFGGAEAEPLRITIFSREISKEIHAVSDPTEEIAFLLIDREIVFAHSDLAGSEAEHTTVSTLSSTDDLDLRNIWANSNEYKVLRDESSHLDRGARGMRVYVYQTSNRPNITLTVGFHAQASVFGAVITDNSMFALVALGVLVVSVAIGVIMSLTLSRPIQRLAGAARQIATLSLERAPRLEPSMMGELADANRAFLSAFRALSAFAKFVPREVVKQVMDGSAVGAGGTETRTMTVMFTDLAGFTSFAAQRSASETAGLLNDHFELVTSIIDREGGTVDKFLGDGVMAFWGAPVRQRDHAERALRAIHAIAEAFGKDAATPMCLRVGVSTGEVLVGVTGSEIRANYTVIGDAVNVAARLQELGKEVAAGERIVALADGVTVRAARPNPPWIDLGKRNLRGRNEPTQVYRLAME